jgi:xanthine dehydrogenase accessory factor
VSWIEELAHMSSEAVRVTLVEADGSSPREAGAAMLVSGEGVTGSIGGGALEHQAIARARTMLGDLVPGCWPRSSDKIALGPSLGQCCGGAVRLLYERFGPAEQRALLALSLAPGARHGVLARPLDAGTPPRLVDDRKSVAELPKPVASAVSDMLSGLRPRRTVLIRDWLIEPCGAERPALHVYGAGHVGRAVIAMAALLPLDVIWLDTAAGRFPAALPGDIRCQIAPDLAEAAGRADAGCYHLVMTYSHAIDLAVCHSLLQRNDFAFLGLIGSATKRARFLSRLRQAGIGDAALQRLTCPIGVDGIDGKEPGTIAVSALAQVLRHAGQTRGRGHGEIMGATAS